jgi:hypothetical protein
MSLHQQIPFRMNGCLFDGGVGISLAYVGGLALGLAHANELDAGCTDDEGVAQKAQKISFHSIESGQSV